MQFLFQKPDWWLRFQVSKARIFKNVEFSVLAPCSYVGWLLAFRKNVCTLYVRMSRLKMLSYVTCVSLFGCILTLLTGTRKMEAAWSSSKSTLLLAGVPDRQLFSLLLISVSFKACLFHRERRSWSFLPSFTTSCLYVCTVSCWLPSSSCMWTTEEQQCLAWRYLSSRSCYSFLRISDGS